VTAPLKRCGDTLGGGPLTRECTLTWAHPGLHSDQDKTWVGGIECEVPPEASSKGMPGFEIIKEGKRNEGLQCEATRGLWLPAITYKPGWDFYWTEMRDAVDLRVDGVTEIGLKKVRFFNRQQLMKDVIRLGRADIKRAFIQQTILTTERTITQAAAKIDGEPLFEEKKLLTAAPSLG